MSSSSDIASPHSIHAVRLPFLRSSLVLALHLSRLHSTEQVTASDLLESGMSLPHQAQLGTLLLFFSSTLRLDRLDS